MARARNSGRGGGARAGRGHSLRLRLGLGIVLVLGLGALAVAVAAFAYGRAAAEKSFDRLLVGAAHQLAQSISLRRGEILVDLPVSAFELLSLAPRDRVTYGVYGPQGLLTGYDDLPRGAGPEPFYYGRFAGEPARFVRVERYFAERSFTGAVEVVIGQTLEARRDLAAEITRNALIAAALVGLVVSGLAVLAVRAALEPLDRIERALAARDSKDLTPVDVNVPQEIRGLVLTLNGFMARMDRQLAAMRALIADASHQLRTPIAALRAQAELAADEPDPERQRDLVARIHGRARTLSRLTDQLLSHALVIHRADSVELAPLDLRAVAAEAVGQADAAGPERAAEALRLDLPEAPVQARGDALSLIEAVKNLIGNARAHGGAPVTVRVSAEAGRARLAVRDPGPGLPEDQWADAGRRFARTAGISPSSAGLGLAIVQAVARAHGGQMRLGRPPSGGFEVALDLPEAR